MRPGTTGGGTWSGVGGAGQWRILSIEQEDTTGGDDQSADRYSEGRLDADRCEHVHVSVGAHCPGEYLNRSDCFALHGGCLLRSMGKTTPSSPTNNNAKKTELQEATPNNYRTCRRLQLLSRQCDQGEDEEERSVRRYHVSLGAIGMRTRTAACVGVHLSVKQSFLRECSTNASSSTD